MGALAPNVKKRICPFFDFPRKKKYDEALFITKTTKVAKGLKRHWGTDAEFYLDDQDVREKLTVAGQQQYAYVLGALKGFRVIPVVALDRPVHNAAVARLKRTDEIDSPIVAFRAHPQDFEDFDGQQVEYDLDDVFNKFDEIDLVFDCQLCMGLNAFTTAQQIAAFAQKFSSTYKKVRRVIVTGSCIPAKIGEVLGTDDATTIERRELEIIAKAQALSDLKVLAGDYATVSPFYSDKEFDPRILQKVTAPRLIYSFDHSHYVSRGISLDSGGQEQYLDMTKELCDQKFFREGHSFGEVYFVEKSRGIGGNATNATVVKPSVVAHITYMVKGAKL
jgi:hypothetical protein